MRRLTILACLALVAACSPTSAELVEAGQWSSSARGACLADIGQCQPALTCSGSVLAMASEGAGRDQVRTGAAACRRPWAALRLASAVCSLGTLVDAMGEIVDIVAKQLREREAVRVAVLTQAAADVAAERIRAVQRPAPSALGGRAVDGDACSTHPAVPAP